jgi:hypothetical protein
MSKVTIILEDVNDESIAGHVEYSGDTFNPKSHAHQHGLLLMKHLASIAQAQSAMEAPDNRLESLALAAEMADPSIPAVPIAANDGPATGPALEQALLNMRREADQQEVSEIEPEHLPAIAHG